jgi:hypothetical protein
MVDRPRSAAASIFPDLPSDDGRVAEWARQRRDRNDVAAALYPGRQPPRQRSPESERLLRGLKELSAGLARLRKEGRL